MSYKYCPHCGEQLPGFVGGTFDKPSHETFGKPSYVPQEKSERLERPTHYNQTDHWRNLVEHANVLRQEKAFDIILPKSFLSGKTVVHMVFDYTVCPAGGLMMDLVRNVSGTQEYRPPRLSPVELEAMGYLVDGNGKVRLVDDVPIGPIYDALLYWGGEAQYKRWHLSAPVELNPNKKGDPAFMDDNLVAFVAHWKDKTKMDHALTELSEMLGKGIRGGKKVGAPRLVDVFPVQ